MIRFFQNQLRRFQKKTAIFLLPLLPSCFPADLRHSVIQIVVIKQPVDLDQPWQQKKPFKADAMGILVTYGPHKTVGILTTAAMVQETAQIEGRWYVGERAEPLTLVHIEPEVNLALLAFTGNVPSGLRPVELGDNIPLGEKISALQWNREVTALTTYELELRRMEVGESLLGAYFVPQYFLFGTQDSLASSAPLLAKNRLLGLVEYQSDKELQAIPASMIRRFLQNPTAGVPNLELSTQRVEDPALRAYYDVPSTIWGVRITEIEATSPLHGKVKAGDFLLSVNGHEITQRGQYIHPLWGPIPYGYLLSSLSVGDAISLSVYQSGTVQIYTTVLGRFTSNGRKIPYYSSDLTARIPHLIFGGLVFQELSLNYLRTWGPNWRLSAPLSLVQLWSYGNKKSETEHFVIFHKIMSDPFNTGYDLMGEERVERVNGKKIHSLQDLRLALKTPIIRNKEAFAVIQLAPTGGEVVLPYAGLEEAHVRLKENWRLQGAIFYP